MHNSIRREIDNVLRLQGYAVANGCFCLTAGSKDAFRNTHQLARRERISPQKAFIEKSAPFIRGKMVDGNCLEVEKIIPKLIAVTPLSEEEKIFKWWNYVWWSLPFERGYGRQMRYVVWDEYHGAPIGLIGLQSPILSWAPRDNFLGIPADKKDYWVNQSMSIQRLGALPPYNDALGGKLIAMLATSDEVREDFRKKYGNARTVMQNRKLPARLLWMTTTGAFGKSSVYNRLKFRDNRIAEFIGYSSGAGNFHIPNAIYDKILVLLQENGVNIARGYGFGPSRKMRLIDKGLSLLGYKNGNMHGVKRAIYLFPLAKNLAQLIRGEYKNARWHHRDIGELTDFWRERWTPTIEGRREKWRKFDKREFLEQQLSSLEIL